MARSALLATLAAVWIVGPNVAAADRYVVSLKEKGRLVTIDGRAFFTRLRDLDAPNVRDLWMIEEARDGKGKTIQAGAGYLSADKQGRLTFAAKPGEGSYWLLGYSNNGGPHPTKVRVRGRDAGPRYLIAGEKALKVTDKRGKEHRVYEAKLTEREGPDFEVMVIAP